MEEIIAMMIQVFKENQNKPMTVEHLIDFYLKNKQLPFGKPATERQLKEAITTIHSNGTIKKSENKTGTYGKLVTYTYEVSPESGQVGLFV